MKRLVFGLMLLALVFDAAQLSACGDKLLNLGRGVRPDRAFADLNPGSVLAYIRPSSLLEDAARIDLASALKKAGYKYLQVTSEQELSDALRSGAYDVVLADFADAAAVEKLLGASQSRAVLVPVVEKSQKLEADGVSKRYIAIVKAPAKSGKYVEAVDKAMDARRARDKSKTVAAK